MAQQFNEIMDRHGAFIAAQQMYLLAASWPPWCLASYDRSPPW